MAGFPQVARVIIVELFVNGAWTDISSDVYARGKVSISRGRRDEQSRAEPSACHLTINNRSGNYSPRNPMGIYYGSLGRNTPIRISVQLAKDTFTRTVSSDWGTSDTGQTYVLSGSGGAILSSAINVAGGVGTIAIPLASAYRNMDLVGVTLQDVDVSFQVQWALASVTGASVFADVLIRKTSSVNYVYARLIVNPGGSITVGIAYNATAVFIAPDTVVAGLTYSSSTVYQIRVQAEGDTYRAKVWAVATGEPYAWQVTGNLLNSAVAGTIAVQALVQLGNTNTFPVVYSMDNLTVRVPRFTGEVASWPQRWDITGADTYVPIEAAGIKRRLSQGSVTLSSALYRYYSRLAIPPVAYWPGEDLKDAGPSILNALVAGYPLDPNGPLDLAAYSAMPSSSPLFQIGKNPLFNYSTTDSGGVACFANIAIGSATGRAMFRWFMHMPVAGPGTAEPHNTANIAYLNGDTGPSWYVLYNTGGNLTLLAYASPAAGGAQILSYGPFSWGGDIRGRDVMCSLQLTQVGADISWGMSVTDLGVNAGTLQGAGTLTAQTLAPPVRIGIDGNAQLPGTAFGHISVRPEVTSFTEISAAFNGYTGETAGIRIQRLCAEESVLFSYRGDLNNTTPMGAQGVNSSSGRSNVSLTQITTGQTLLDLLNECENADTGTLYEPRGDIGIAYRTRANAYNQAAQLDLDYAAGHVAPPLEPVDDDQLTRNNIITTRVNAGSAEAELIVGRMSTLNPSAGGVGTYNTQYTLNVATDSQLPDLATWLLILGTIDEPRYPTITINLANPDFAAAGLESDALAVDIDDRLTISNPNTAGLPPDQISVLVRGYTETINVFEHTIAFNCSPETPYEIAQVGSSPSYKIDTDTSTLVSGVTATATTLSVANVNQPWTTAAGQMPIQIKVAGEQMSVTAVSGASTPQTFTVTRSVNGVVKAQSAGTVVQLLRFIRPIIGL